MDTQDAHAHLDDVLVTPEQIRSRIAEISREIEADYPDSTPLLVGVLKGAVMVMADLARELKSTSKWTGWRFRATATTTSPLAW